MENKIKQAIKRYIKSIGCKDFNDYTSQNEYNGGDWEDELIASDEMSFLSFYLTPCQSHSDYWLEGRISVRKNDKYYAITFETDAFIENNSIDDAVDSIMSLENRAKETLKIFNAQKND